MLFRISAILLAGVAAIAGAAIAADDGRSATDSKELAKALHGRVADAPVDCLPNLRGTGRMDIIDDNTILFRGGSTVYLQNPSGGCPGIKNGLYTLVVRQTGVSQICRGDIQQLINLQNGVRGGSCVFGPFIPYRKN